VSTALAVGGVLAVFVWLALWSYARGKDKKSTDYMEGVMDDLS